MTAYRILLAGNPNVGKSTVFNALTGLKQHTGNWSGKTVDLACGTFCCDGVSVTVTDLPGTYSVISNSAEEEIARNAILFEPSDLVLAVADATCLARNLNLLLQIREIAPSVALCVNLMDEAERKGIAVDLAQLEQALRIPVIGISAHRKRDLSRLKHWLTHLLPDMPMSDPSPPFFYPQPIEDAMARLASYLPPSDFSERVLPLKALDNPAIAAQLLDALSIGNRERCAFLSAVQTERDALSAQGISPVHLRDMVVESIVATSNRIASAHTRVRTPASHTYKWDKILTSRRFGIPIMLGFLGLLLWITVCGANLPSQLLFSLFEGFTPYLSAFWNFLHLPPFFASLLTDGVYHTVSWVTAVMLPPMAIFFPLFTLLEDLGFLPRLAFNMDRCFCSAGTCGKQALTMCMGLGCNAVGVTGCRIFSSERERLAAMITNCFIPCNGRFSMLITLSSLFLGTALLPSAQSLVSALFILCFILIGTAVTLGVTKLFTLCFFREDPVGFSLELPPFRKPKIGETLLCSLVDRTVKILVRAIRVSAPAGAVIWLMANITVCGESILQLCAGFLDPFARLMGMDGIILLAFLLALPANEIVLPIILMGYLSVGTFTDMASTAAIGSLLTQNGWDIGTAVCVMLFSLLHFPCGTTLLTLYKESGSIRWMFLGFLIPTACAVLVCMICNGIFSLLV